MNQIIQSGLAWLGGLTVIAYIALAASIGIDSVLEGRRLKKQRAAIRAQRAPITESEIAAVDLDAELFELLKGDQQ